MPERSVTETRLARADWGQPTPGELDYLDYPQGLPVVKHPIDDRFYLVFLSDIALSLRRLVIIADAIRRGDKE